MRETLLSMLRGAQRTANSSRAGRETARAAAAWPAVLLVGLLTCVGAALVVPPSRTSLLAVGVVLVCVAARMRRRRRAAASP